MEHEPAAATEWSAAEHSLPGGPDDAPPATLTDRLQWLALAILAISLLVGAVRALQAGWIPVGDEALIEMRVRDVPAHFPLLGVYSRFGWSHPGPAQFLALALPYRLLGSVSAALLAGALAGHLLAVTAAWWIARRIDATVGLLVLVAFELVLLCVPVDLVRSAWNPYVALLGAGLMVVVAWGWAERRGAAALLLLPLATLLVQSHVGNLPLVAMVLLAATPLAIWSHARTVDPTDRPVPWRSLGLGAAIAALLWIPAIVEQLTSDPGNATKMIRDLSNDAPRVGMAHALGGGTRFFAWLPVWADRHSLVLQIADTGWAVPIWLLVPVVAVVVAVRRRDTPMVRGLVISGIGVMSTVVAAASIKGVFFSYLIVGSRSIVAVCMAISVGALLAALPVSTRSMTSTLLAAVAVASAVLVGVLQWSAHNPSVPFDPTVRAVTAAVERGANGAPVFITSTGDDPSRDVASGLLLQLERAGVPATTVIDEDWRMGSHRTSDGVPPGALQIRLAPAGSEQQLTDGGYRILLNYQPLNADEVAAVSRLTAERDALIAEGAADATGSRAAAIRYVQVQALAQKIDSIRDGQVSAVVGARG